MNPTLTAPSSLHFKDEVLDAIAETRNVAQFVSFGPSVEQRFCRIVGFKPNHKFDSPAHAIGALLKASSDGKVNVRSYFPHSPQNNDFIRLLDTTPSVVEVVDRLAGKGLFTIVNEDIDVNDGGVSGVYLNGNVEFAPGDTPRCVERKDVATFSVMDARLILSWVYGVEPDLNFGEHSRVEFSFHPFPRGYRGTHTIIWEQESSDDDFECRISWPNEFSAWVGDKTFGLLIAHLLSLSVPSTLVLPRRMPPFRFGQQTGSCFKWVRTAPSEKTPGFFTTFRGWLDPFRLVAKEDPEGTRISSILVQDEVSATYSGGIITEASGKPKIEGMKGFGDRLMLGQSHPAKLPMPLQDILHDLHEKIGKTLGSVRFEWAFDGKRVWILQLQQEASYSEGDVIFPGEPKSWTLFRVRPKGDSLEDLRKFIDLLPADTGIILSGKFGLTSHIADLLRKEHIPSRRERTGNPEQLQFHQEKRTQKRSQSMSGSLFEED